MSNLAGKHQEGNIGQRNPERDRWRTPEYIFQFAEDYFNARFELDAAADADNSLCKIFISQGNPLAADWGCHGVVWCNPPFSLVGKFVDRAIMHSQSLGEVVMLTKAAVDTRWFWSAYKTAAEIVLINGRVNYLDNSGREIKGCTFPSMLINWRPHEYSPARLTCVRRDDICRP